MTYFCLPLLFAILALVLGPLFLLNIVKIFTQIILKCKKLKFLERIDKGLHFFTPFENLKAVFSLKKENPKVHICCFDGMRTLGVLLIISGHLMDWLNFKTPKDDWSVLFFAHFDIWVDAFFLMGGFLGAKSLMTQFAIIDSFWQFSYWQFALKRYLRLLPTVLSAIFLHSILNFALKEEVDFLRAQQCLENWHLTVLFIENWFTGYACCATWYLAADMQMHMVSPFLIYFLSGKTLWRQRLGVLLNLAVILASALAAFAANYTEELTYVYGKPFFHPDFTYYRSTYCRIGPFCVGIILGYLLKHYPNLLASVKSWAVWVLEIACIVGIFLITYLPIAQTVAPSAGIYHRIAVYVYMGLYRTIYATFWAFLVYICIAEDHNKRNPRGDRNRPITVMSPIDENNNQATEGAIGENILPPDGAGKINLSPDGSIKNNLTPGGATGKSNLTVEGVLGVKNFLTVEGAAAVPPENSPIPWCSLVASRILSLPLFRPISRLSYQLYLLHCVIYSCLTYPYSRGQEHHTLRFYFSNLLMILAETLVASAFFYSVVEVPFNRIVGALFAKVNDKSKAKPKLRISKPDVARGTSGIATTKI